MMLEFVPSFGGGNRFISIVLICLCSDDGYHIHVYSDSVVGGVE